MVAASQGDGVATWRQRTALLARRATHHSRGITHETNRVARSDLPPSRSSSMLHAVWRQSMSATAGAQRDLRPSKLTVGRQLAPSARPCGPEHPRWWWTAVRRSRMRCQLTPADEEPRGASDWRLDGGTFPHEESAPVQSPRCCGSASGLGRGRVGANRVLVTEANFWLPPRCTYS